MTVGHTLRLYNSMGRRLEEFTPAGAEVGMYSCGPTVYAFPHLGNMRAYVFADTLRRALRWKGYPVRHVVNITDVGHAMAETELGEDKIEAAAARERRSVEEVAAFYTRAFFDDVAALNILTAHDFPRASEYVEEMIEFARVLEVRGCTYLIPSGLYLDTSRSPGYGQLALMDVAGQREGARVEQVEGRRNKTDFALWRTEQTGQMRAMRWKSPWGWGAPGWHLECSVMSIVLLGKHFDIHTGGVDHRELHHVNEIAQSEAYLDDGRPWVRYWLHNEFLRLDEQKISKSAGHTLRVADLVDAGYHPLAYRLFLLTGHYRSQLDFTHAAIEAAHASLRRLVARLQPLQPMPTVDALVQAQTLLAEESDETRALLDQIDASIANDLNTPQVLATLQEVLRSTLTDRAKQTLAAVADAVLGLGLADLRPDALERRRSAAELDGSERAAIEQLVEQRARARHARDFAEADRIRAELEGRGVQLTDTPNGTVWSLR